MLRVYGDGLSGNCYKIRLLLSHLNLPHEWNHVDILKQQTHSDDFLRLNPNGKIPVLVLDDGQTLTESNAILHYLADGSDWLPEDRLLRARVLQWQFFEQYSHEPFIAVARYIQVYLNRPAEREAEYQGKQAGGHKALAVMDQQLAQSPFLVGDSPTIADLSLYAYTHVAGDGGFDLDGYRQVRDWLARVAALPGHVPMKADSGFD